eukprot:2456033-Lingulodinium_polyedra.AAC.1
MRLHARKALAQGNEDHAHMSGRAETDRAPEAQRARLQIGGVARLKQGVIMGSATVQGGTGCGWPCPYPRARRWAHRA